MSNLFLSLHFFSIYLLLIFMGSLAIYVFHSWIHSPFLQALSPGFKMGIWLILPLCIFFCILLVLNQPLLQQNIFLNSYKEFHNLYFNKILYIVRNIFVLGVLVIFSMKKETLPGPLILIGLVLASTVLANDWLASLEPHWHSSILGFILFSNALLIALAFQLFILKSEPSINTLRHLNTLHLVFIAFWAYLNICQLIIIWSANLPHEMSWYIPRLRTNWKYLIFIVMIFQVAMSLVLLLFKNLKSSFRFTQNLAFLTLIMQILFLTWMIFPSFDRLGLRFHLSLAGVYIFLIAGLLTLKERISL